MIIKIKIIPQLRTFLEGKLKWKNKFASLSHTLYINFRSSTENYSIYLIFHISYSKLSTRALINNFKRNTDA